jgi:two-component system response regulator PhoP
MRVLLVEDDQELSGQLQRRLQRDAFQVCAAGDANEARFFCSDYAIDVAIIDLGLPRMDGIELIKLLRDDGYDFPVIILTARSGWRAKVEGLEAGADDYLTKPFQSEELIARLNALLRRAAGHSSQVLSSGPLRLDIKSSVVRFDESELNLTGFEYKLLKYFMLNPGKVVSKAALIDLLYDMGEDRDSNVVEVIIARLRKKIDPQAQYKPIETLRGRGYRFSGLGDSA